MKHLGSADHHLTFPSNGILHIGLIYEYAFIICIYNSYAFIICFIAPPPLSLGSPPTHGDPLTYQPAALEYRPAVNVRVTAATLIGWPSHDVAPDSGQAGKYGKLGHCLTSR